MNILLKAATVIDPDSPFHHQTVDILIKNGVITSIDSLIENQKNTQVIKLDNLHVSQGWFDSSVSFGEPGYEERETIANGLEVAAKSGFTHIALNPDTLPIPDNGAAIGFLKAKSSHAATLLHPIGSLTNGSEGRHMSELYDMYQTGAIAFGDYKKPIEDPNVLKIALQYAQIFNGLIISFPQNNAIAGKGNVHEDTQSTSLGLKGIPALAEEMQISRDLFLLEYTGGRLHIPTISTAKSVSLIREAKKQGLSVSCSVSVHHLALTDEELITFDTRYKTLPPLRTKNDIEGLIKGIEDGTIDMVTCDHQPVDIEHKKTEFDNAYYGTIGLESCFGILNEILPTEKVIDMLTRGTKIFDIEPSFIDTGNAATLSLFNPKESSIFSQEDILSTSKNSAFIGKKTNGCAYGSISKGKISLKQH